MSGRDIDVAQVAHFNHLAARVDRIHFIVPSLVLLALLSCYIEAKIHQIVFLGSIQVVNL
jgi:hypothetical protein